MVPRTRSLRFTRLLLALVLVFAALLPAALFAQEDVVGVWESDVIDAGIEGSDGLIVTISLFDDGTMETTSDFQDGEAVIFEQGDWWDNGDGTYTISFITSDGEPYEEPVDVVFALDDDTLTAAELTDYGDDGLVVVKVDDEPVSQAEDFGFEATADVVAAVRGEETEDEGEDAVDEDVFDIEGVYISDELIDETGTGAVMLYLSEDGAVQSLFANFDAESAPSGRLGTWEETEDGLIAISLDQDFVIEGDEAAAEDLDEPEEIEFELVNGVLVNELFTLYPVDEISEFWSFDFEDEGDDEIGVDDAEDSDAADSDAAADDSGELETMTYTSSLDEMAAGNSVILIADIEGGVTVSIERVDADISEVLIGTWEETEDGVWLTLTEDVDGNELDEPVEVLLVEDEDGNMVGEEFDTELFGETLVLEPLDE